MNSLQLMEMFLVAAAAIYLMMLAGTAKSALERKRPPRVCPSCGRTNCRCRR